MYERNQRVQKSYNTTLILCLYILRLSYYRCCCSIKKNERRKSHLLHKDENNIVHSTRVVDNPMLRLFGFSHIPPEQFEVQYSWNSTRTGTTVHTSTQLMSM